MAKETTKKSTKTTKKTPVKAAAAKATAKKTTVKATAQAAAAKTRASAKAAKMDGKDAAQAAVTAPATAAAAAKTSGTTGVKTPAPAAHAVKPAAAGASAPSGKLKKWNYALAALYAVQAVVIVSIGNKTAVPITAQFPSVDSLASDAAGHQVVSSAFRQLFSMELGWMIAAFLLVFATVRYMAGRKVRVQDQPGTDNATAAARWMSFGFGGGLVVTTIALLSGMTQIGTLLLLFISVLVGCALGFAAEMVIDRNNGMWTRMARFLGNMSIIGIIVPWVVFAVAAIGAALWNGHLPVYLYSIYGCIALLTFGTILATYFYFARQGRWADPLYAERSFMLLEFLIASYLTWQTFVGVLHS